MRPQLRMIGNTPNSLTFQLQTIVQAVLGVIHNAEGALFSAVIAHFRADEMPDRHSTRVAYESMLRKWIEPRWENIPVTAIRTADVVLLCHK